MLGDEASWDESPAAHADFLHHFIREQGVQTNEVQRSWVLLPLFLHATRAFDEFDVVELGPSGGLNLVWDRYRYAYAAGEWGPADSPLRMTGEERSPVPAGLLARRPRVRRRVGIDLAPIDVATDDGARLLKCFVWADQTERLERMTRAIEVVRGAPPELVRGDIAEELPRVLDEVPTLVLQTAVFGYVDDETRRRVRETFARVRAPVVFVTAGRPRGEEYLYVWGMRVVSYPGGEREFVGHADVHGAWLEYSL